ncbi:MAG: hypothetical protein WBY44_32745 [Bryobacteraceae bacterium]
MTEVLRIPAQAEDQVQADPAVKADKAVTETAFVAAADPVRAAV